MTKKQIREHKLGNQRRKNAILNDKATRAYWGAAKVGQDSAHAR
jgi:hypothetical protein